MKPFLTQISVLLVVLFSGHSLAADGVTVTPELSASADQIAAAETRIRAFINTQDVTQDELRAVVENAATGVVSRIGETATNELRNLVTGYQNLRRELTDGDGVSSAELLETFYGASRPAASGSGKRPGEEETPEERRAREAAERRAAQRAAADREAIRVLEREQDRQQIAQQLAAAQQGGQGGKGKGSSGQDSSGNSNQNFPQPQPQNNNNDNFANQSNNGFDRLANRLGNLGNQGFGNFSSSQNSSKKEEEKKSSFSLPESKKSFSEDFAFQTKPKSTPTLPALQTGDQSFPGKAQAMELQGTPLQPAPPYNPASNIVSNGFKPSGGFGATGGNAPTPMLGGMMGGMGGMMGGQLGGQQGFPFDITGQPYDPEAEEEQFPRYRVYDVSMSGSSSGGSDSSPVGDLNSSNDSSLRNDKKIGIPQFLYFMSPEEESLKGVPGIFRSLAAGYRKTRIQLLCGLKDRKKIGLCEKVRNNIDG